MGFDGLIIGLINKFNGFGMILYVLITTFFAALFAFFIGIGRQLRGKTISVKTFILLSIGCSLLMNISIWAVGRADANAAFDASRIASGVVTGMGFLGAGAIIKDKLNVRGLPTAATLWVSGAVGLACGSGFVLESFAFTALTIIIMFFVNIFNRRIERHAKAIILRANNDVPLVSILNQIEMQNDMIYKNIDIVEVNDKQTTIRVIFTINSSKNTIQYFKNQVLNTGKVEVVENK